MKNQWMKVKFEVDVPVDAFERFKERRNYGMAMRSMIGLRGSFSKKAIMTDFKRYLQRLILVNIDSPENDKQEPKNETD